MPNPEPFLSNIIPFFFSYFCPISHLFVCRLHTFFVQLCTFFHEYFLPNFALFFIKSHFIFAQFIIFFVQYFTFFANYCAFFSRLWIVLQSIIKDGFLSSRCPNKCSTCPVSWDFIISVANPQWLNIRTKKIVLYSPG